MEAPQMRGVEEPLLPEPRAVEGGATQSEGAIETQEARYPRLHKTAGLRSLDVWVEISSATEALEGELTHLRTASPPPPLPGARSAKKPPREEKCRPTGKGRACGWAAPRRSRPRPSRRAPDRASPRCYG